MSRTLWGWIAVWCVAFPLESTRADEPWWMFPRDQELGGGWTYSVGGEFRHRYMDERNRLRPMGGDGRNTYDLWRFAPFLEIKHDSITGFVQAIDASIFNQEFGITPIDKNRADLLRYYVDANLFTFDSGGELHLKVGRQFLSYGSQRLISPLAWSNTFRNFEGARLYYFDDAWSIDAFAVRPVNGAAIPNQFRPTSSDRPDASYWLSGLYLSYKEMPGGVADWYWIWSREDEPLAARQDGNRHTLGARYQGSAPAAGGHDWIWDAEGAWQFGQDNFGGTTRDVNAGFIGLLAGMAFPRTAGKPKLEGIFWWGSGDGDPADGQINTVTTLHPLGHAYWGLIDNFNGSNLIDTGVQFSVAPVEKLSLLAAFHFFHQAQAGDHVYNIAGAALGDPAATGNRHLGNELDLVATYQFNPQLQIQAGYFWFWYGGAVTHDRAVARRDAQQFYLQTTLGF
jgi:hypothetical protein